MANSVNCKIHYTKPSITELEVHYATDAAGNGWGEHCYDYIFRFEEARKGHLGVEYAIASSSCPAALHLGMHALGIGPGDEVHGRHQLDRHRCTDRAPGRHAGVCGHPAVQLVHGSRAGENGNHASKLTIETERFAATDFSNMPGARRGNI
jgi:hypothetical protein